MDRPDKKEFKPELETPFQSPRYLDDTHASAGQYNIDEYSKAQDKYIDSIETDNKALRINSIYYNLFKVAQGYVDKYEVKLTALAETNQHQGEALKIQDMEIERLNSLTKYCEYSDCKGIKR